MTHPKKQGRDVAWLLCGTAAALALAGCGGGGGATAATGSPTAATSAGSGTSTASATGSSSTSSTSAAGSTTAQAPVPTAATTTGPMLGNCEMFPSNAIFNTRIDDTSRFPADPSSDAWVNLVGASTPFHADWGTSSNPADLTAFYGIPINYVDGTPATTQWPTVAFDFAPSGQSTEVGHPEVSDCAAQQADGSFAIVQGCSQLATGQRRFPFPSQNVLAEGGNCGGPGSCGDHHVVTLEQGSCRLWEAFYAFPINGQWYTSTSAAWNLHSLSLRPDGWSSADAAGLPITPLLAKASEASSGAIRHALRVTFRDAAIALQHRWPARFAAGADNPGAIPFGALLRLKADFVIPDNWTPQAKALATAAKQYGMYVADNGADFYVQGEPSAAWDMTTLGQLGGITMADMEFVDLKAITSDPRFSPDSMAASW